MLEQNYFVYRELEKREKERKEKEKEERRRQERKNRDAFKELLATHRDDGIIVPKMRWKVILSLSVLEGPSKVQESDEVHVLGRALI